MKKLSVIFFIIISSITFNSMYSKTLKIAVASPFTGDLANIGIPVKNAAMLAVQDINAKGGVLGKTLELLTEDDQCRPEKAANVAHRVVSQNIVGVIGHFCSGSTKAALGIYQGAKIPVISPGSTNTDLTLKGGYTNFFRTIAHDGAQATLQIQFVTNQLKAKRVVVIHDKTDYGKGLGELVKKGLEKQKVNVVLFEGITIGAVDYSAVIHKISKANVEVVVFAGLYPEASKLITQAREKNIQAKFISGDGVKENGFIQLSRGNAEGYYVTGPADTSSIKMYQKVSKKYQKMYGEKHGTFSMQAYAAVLALVNAFEKAKSTDYQKVLSTLKKEKVQTPLGNISFDSKGDVLGTGFAVFQVKNNNFVMVK